MEGLPSDIFDHDVKSFPTEDSALAKKLETQMKRAQEAEEKEQKKRGRPPGSTKTKSSGQPQAKQQPEMPSEPKNHAGTIQQKTQKIRLYFTYLSHKFSFAEPKTYPVTHAGLDEILDKIKCQLHGEGGIQKAGVLYQMSAVGLEKLLEQFNPLGWQLSGPTISLSAAVAANKAQWEDLVKEFAIENSAWFMFGPGKRLVATTVQLILAVDNANKAARHGGAPPVASEDLEREAKEL